CSADRAIDGSLEQALGARITMADAEQRRSPERAIDVGERYGLELARERPAATVPLFGAHDAAVAQSRHGPPEGRGIRLHHRPKRFRGDRLIRLAHVQEHVQSKRESAVPSHVTLYVT